MTKRASATSRAFILGLLGALVLGAAAFSLGERALAHGDVQPQPVDTAGLETLGEEWRKENPYRGNATAIKIGGSAYTQNCARCHGLEVISGGLAPDLRNLEPGQPGDEWFLERVRHGARKTDGSTMMPPFEGLMNQEAMWAIRAYIETKKME